MIKKFFQEFREFAVKGNALNLAVGVLIGAAFQSVVTSLTADILSPIIGLFTGQNFDSLHVQVFGVTIRYGSFITSVINFIIMAFVIFILIKSLDGFKNIGKNKKTDAPAPEARKCPYCMTIVDNKATRCPACTSELTDESGKEDENA